MSEERFPSGAFIGRQRELGELRRRILSPRADAGTLVLLRGEGGIGKTRLAEEIAQSAREHGHRVYWGRCMELAGAPAFWPWVQVLRQIAAEHERLDEISATERVGVTRLLPELHWEKPGVASSSAVPVATDAAAQAEHERFQLFDGITNFLRRIASHRPYGIVFDDLHAADPPSLLLLEFVARQVQTLPIWLIVTYREVEAHADAQRRQLTLAVERLGRSLPLAGLSRTEVEALIAATCGEPAPAAIVDQIYALTEGNPFFVDELARLLWPGATLREAPLRHEAIPVPSGVSEIVRQRLLPLTADCLCVLQAAAVIGREFSLALLREATGRPAADLLDLLDQAQRLSIVTGARSGCFQFAHALIRETLYGDLHASLRVDLHRQVGAAIERLYADAIDDQLAALAFHYSRVAPVADAEKALGYIDRAAKRAVAMLAYEEAAGFYELALDTLSLLPERARGEESGELWLALGDAHVRAGDTPRARAAFERAATTARDRHDPHRLARAALGCGGLGLGVPAGTVDGGLVAWIEEALAQPQDSYPSDLRARLLARLALELYFSDAADRRQNLMKEASELAERANAATRAYVSHARLVGLWDLTPPPRRLAASDELIRLGESLGDEEAALRGHSYRLLEIIDTGLADDWEPELDAISRIVTRLREPRFAGMAKGTRAMRSLWLGRLAETEALGQAALADAQSVNDMQIPVSVAVQKFMLRRLQGAAEEVEAAARLTAAAAPTIPGTRCMLVLALCDLGRYDEARTELQLLGGVDFEPLRRANRLASLVPWLAEASATLKDEARMAVLRRDLLPLSGRNISLQARVCFGPADYFLGMIESRLGRLQDAVRRLDAASRLAARMDGLPLCLLIDLERARAYALAGDAVAAEAIWRTVIERATPFGMQALVRSAEAARREFAISAAYDAVATVPPVREVALGGGGRGRVVPFTRPIALVPDADATRVVARPRTATLRRDGGLWTVASGGTVLRCKHSKGLQYLATLLRHPGRSFHVIELAAFEVDAEYGKGADRDLRSAPGARVGAAQLGEPIADAKAIAAYRSRLQSVREELDEAHGRNDLARREQLEEEADALTSALAGAMGLGGRLRTTGSTHERARLNVTRALRSAIERIREGHAELGQHLGDRVRTGMLCCYAATPRDSLVWEL